MLRVLALNRESRDRALADILAGGAAGGHDEFCWPTTFIIMSHRQEVPPFDITSGWGDKHPVGTPVVAVTHRPPGCPHDATVDLIFGRLANVRLAADEDGCLEASATPWSVIEVLLQYMPEAKRAMN